MLDVNVRRLGRHERSVTCNGQRYRVVAASQGPRLTVEVDGVTHIIDRDDGGGIRALAPAFLVAVPVAEGDKVRAGDPLAVVESMKMETTITAPYPGTVRAVLARVSTQVEAGAPLVQLQPPDRPGHGAPGPRIDLASLAGPGPGRPDIGPAGSAAFRAGLLGYDLDEAAAGAVSGWRPAAAYPDASADRRLLGEEQELLETFADLTALSRREPDHAGGRRARSDHEHLLAYLAFLDPERSGVPGDFVDRLRAALARYGVTSLRRTPELEPAMLRLYRSLGRLPAAARPVVAVLDRWRRHRDALAAAMTRDRLAVLDRLPSPVSCGRIWVHCPSTAGSSWTSSPGGPARGSMPTRWPPSSTACSRGPASAVRSTASTSPSPPAVSSLVVRVMLVTPITWMVRLVWMVLRSICGPSTSPTASPPTASPRTCSSATCTRCSPSASTYGACRTSPCGGCQAPRTST